MSELTVKDLNEYTIEELLDVPNMDWDETRDDFDSIIIIPTDQKHDSGFRCMEFVGCIGHKPIARMSGCSDVVHINGIGGYGKSKKYNQLIPATGWSIDCLNTSGLLRLFVDPETKIENSAALSSFEVFAIKK